LKALELSIDQMNMVASEVTAVLHTLANENRLLLLCQLSRGEKCVGELEQLLDIHQPTLSQQLGVLRKEGVVMTRREGKNIYYSIADTRVLVLLKTMYEIYCVKTGSKTQ
jgi:DNA-binding transcriptional ArsR family regulator